MPIQSQHFSSTRIRGRRDFPNRRKALPVVFTDILHFCCQKFTQKVAPRFHKPTTSYMCTLLWSHTQVHLQVNGSVCAKFGDRWSRLAGSRSPQRLFWTQ